MWGLVMNFCKCSSLLYMHLVSGLRVILNLHVGSEKLTNAEVIDAVKIIQQLTKRKSSSLGVFKFQDVSILLL